MTQNINDLKAGQIIMMYKNNDGTFSPIGISKDHVAFLNRILSLFTESEALCIDSEIKLVIENNY